MQKKIEYAQGNNSGVTTRKRLAVQRQRELVSTPVVCCKSQEPKNKKKKKERTPGRKGVNCSVEVLGLLSHKCSKLPEQLNREGLNLLNKVFYSQSITHFRMYYTVLLKES